MGGPMVFMLFAAWVVCFVLWIDSLPPVVTPPTPHAHVAKHHRTAQCGTPTPPDYAVGYELDYDDVAEEMHRRCDVRKFPYCHTLPIPFYRQLDSTYFDLWEEWGCERDLLADDYPDYWCGVWKNGDWKVRWPCAPTPLAPVR